MPIGSGTAPIQGLFPVAGQGASASGAGVGPIIKMVGYYTGAGNSNLTKVVAPGIVSVTRTAVGKHTVVFQDVGGDLIGADIVVHTGASALPLVGKIVPASYSAANKSVDIEFWDLGAASGALADAAAATMVLMEFSWSKGK